MRTKTSINSLISQLEQLRDEVGGDAAVLVDGREGGYNHIKGFEQHKFVYDPLPYCGDYEIASDSDQESFKGVVVY